MTMQEHARLRRLTIYIKPFDQKRRDAWLETTWETPQHEVFSLQFIDLDHALIRRLAGTVIEIEQLNIVIEPRARDDTDIWQVMCLWAKVRDVAFFLSSIEHWGVRKLSIQMTSEWPRTFNLKSTPLSKLPRMIKCDYDFLSMVHMALLEPLVSANKLHSTSLDWYHGDPPDKESTPQPLLDLVNISARRRGAGLSSFANRYSPSAHRDSRHPNVFPAASQLLLLPPTLVAEPNDNTALSVEANDVNNYWHKLTLTRMRVEALNITFAFDSVLDTLHGTAANHLRLQRLRTWNMGENCALSLESLNKTVCDLKLNRQYLQYLKNLRQVSLQQSNPAVHKRHLEEAMQDSEWRGHIVRHSQALWNDLLPTSSSSCPTAVGQSKSIVACWTQHNMQQHVPSEVRRIIEDHVTVDKWSSQYPLGIPSLNYIREHTEEEDGDGQDEA
ncbi:hypothetical protein PG994_007341 [Apiospora phragmitis]|uniref:Uncharacterized protein n=1 Tax=Apiospora phragmitis TaxID=2905665 RepID=A0ABR1V0M3_9PEZI